MKKTIGALLAALFLLTAPSGLAEGAVAISESLSLSLPVGIVALTAEEAAESERIRAVLEAVSDSAENLFIGALPADGEAGGAFGAVYIIQREREAAASSGVSKIGTYADTNDFARGLAKWYRAHYPDFYVVDALSGVDGAPVLIVHVETDDGIALLGETYSTDYSDSIIACFFDKEGATAEPTQAQYDAFVAMLETVSVK